MTTRKTATNKAPDKAPATATSGKGFGKFLGKYAGELLTVTSIVRALLPAAPVGRDDRSRIEAGLRDLEMSAERVAEAGTKYREVTVTPTADDIEAAVAKLLPDALAEALERLGIGAAKAEGS